MHELSIATSLIDLACETAEHAGADRIERLHVKIGALAGVVTDALRFSFEVASEGTLCDGAVLEIQQIEVAVRCSKCEARSALSSPYTFACPVCGNPSPEVVAGQELELTSIEIPNHASTCA